MYFKLNIWLSTFSKWRSKTLFLCFSAGPSHVAVMPGHTVRFMCSHLYLDVNQNKTLLELNFHDKSTLKTVAVFPLQTPWWGHVEPLKINPDHVELRVVQRRDATPKGRIGNARLYGFIYLPLSAAAPAPSTTSAAPRSASCSAFVTVSETIGEQWRPGASLNTCRDVTRAQCHNAEG